MTNGKSRLSVSQDRRTDASFESVLAAERFDALGDATRRSILQLLQERAHTVGELADRLPVSRPAVSQHVKVLRETGLVQVTTEGTRRVVTLDPEGLEAARGALDELWRSALDTFASEAGAEVDRPGER